MKKVTTVLFLLAVLHVTSSNISESHLIPQIFKINQTAAMVHVVDQNFSVKTIVKEDDVFIECYVKDYRFTQSNNKEQASIAVSVDGKKHSVRKTAAFILKDLPNGKHSIKLELIKENGEKVGLQKEFEVHIQSAI